MSGFEYESSDDDNDSSQDDDESRSILETDKRTFNYNNECTFQYSGGSIHRFAALSTAPNQHFSDFSDLNLLSKPRDTNSGFEIELKGNEEKLNESDSETETALWSESKQEYSDEDNDFSEDDDESSSPEDGDKLALNAITGHGQTRTLEEGMLNMDGNKVDLRDEKESESKTKRQGNPRDFVQTQHASEFCTEEARKQLNQMAEVFAKGKELPASILKPLKDIRKALAPEYGKVLFKEYFEHLRVSGSELSATAKEIPSFVEECFEICWLMKVQDPPIVLDPSAKTGESFNKDHYKAYTKSGDHISFIVWPALLLHQDGPVLCKGVAQGK